MGKAGRAAGRRRPTRKAGRQQARVRPFLSPHESLELVGEPPQTCDASTAGNWLRRQRVMAAAERKGETTCRLTAEIARWLRGGAEAEAAPASTRFLLERRDKAGRSCSPKRFCFGAKKPGRQEGVLCAETVPVVRKNVAATCVADRRHARARAVANKYFGGRRASSWPARPSAPPPRTTSIQVSYYSREGVRRRWLQGRGEAKLPPASRRRRPERGNGV